MSSLPLLDQIQIGSPCDADWDAMRGDERMRYCGLCKLDVYNVSAMSRTEAEALLVNREGRLCARFARRPDGTVVTRDCGPVRSRIQRRIRRLRAVAAGLLGLMSTLALSACGREGPPAKTPPVTTEPPAPDPVPLPEIMGDIACPEELMGAIAVPPPPSSPPPSSQPPSSQPPSSQPIVEKPTR